MMVVTTEVSPTKMADLSRQVLPSDGMTVNHNLTHAPLKHNCRLVQASYAREDGNMRENPCYIQCHHCEDPMVIRLQLKCDGTR